MDWVMKGRVLKWLHAHRQNKSRLPRFAGVCANIRQVPFQQLEAGQIPPCAVHQGANVRCINAGLAQGFHRTVDPQQESCLVRGWRAPVGHPQPCNQLQALIRAVHLPPKYHRSTRKRLKREVRLAEAPSARPQPRQELGVYLVISKYAQALQLLAILVRNAALAYPGLHQIKGGISFLGCRGELKLEYELDFGVAKGYFAYAYREGSARLKQPWKVRVLAIPGFPLFSCHLRIGWACHKTSGSTL